MRQPPQAAGTAWRLRWLLALAVAAASLGGAAAQAQPCQISFMVTLRNFNKAGAGPAGNPDFGFLPEPANVNDRKIVQAVLPASGLPAYRPATGFNTTTTHSKIDFDQWFSPSAPFIQDAIMDLDFVVTGTASSFQFNSATFWPLDGQLLGTANPGVNNQYFTMELRTAVKYLQFSAGRITLATNCDLFVYMNGELVIDLGGVHGQQSATLNLGLMGLQNGVTYPLVMFLAQRHASPTAPTFNFATSVEFASGETAADYCQGVAQDAGNPAANDTSLDAVYPTTQAPPADGFPGVPGCNSVWGVAGNDSCAAIANKSGLQTAAAVLALNPGLDCAQLTPGQLVCTGTGGAPTATCGNRVYETGAGDSCLTVRSNFGTNGSPIKYAVLSALNPDVNCGPTGQSPLPAGTVVCLPQVLGASTSGRRRLQSAGNESEDVGVVQLDEGVDSTGFISTAVHGLQEALEHRRLLQEGLLAQSGSGEDDVLQGHLPSLLHGFSDAAQEFRRTLQATTVAAAGSCIGASFTVTASGCSVNCAAAASQAGLTVTQLVLLNPQLVNNPSKTCRVTAGQSLCKGCVGTICGVKLSASLSEFLNFPNLNLLMCGLLADCGNPAYIAGAGGGQDEELTITMSRQSASTRAYTAAGGEQIAAFFASDGAAVNNPGSLLHLSIYPNYYNGVPRLAKGGSAGLVSWVQTVVLPDAPASGTARKLQAAESGELLDNHSDIMHQGRRLQGFRRPVYLGKARYRQASRNPRTMVISRYRRIW